MKTTRPAEIQKGVAQLNVIAACGCGCASAEVPPDDGKRAVAVDPEAKSGNLRRLRRLEGQVRGLQKMIEEDRYCPDIMIQISAAQEALRTVGRELMRNHLRHCVTHALSEGPPEQADAMYDELVELIFKHAR
jgi:DNA-binding FrmR family transcriptional regulator